MFGCNGKYNFLEIVFLLTIFYAFDPEMNLHSHFHFNSFPSHSPHTATQREREKRNTKVTRTQRERELRSSHRDLRSSHPDLWSSHRELRAQNATAFGESERKNPLLRSTSRRWRRVQPDDHRPDERPIQLSQSITGPATPITEPNTLSRWVFRHRFTVHTLTSPLTHTCPIHTLTSPVRSLHYIYIYIYIFIYFFLFINFFNYQCFIKLCIYGLCIWNVGAFLFAGYWRLVFHLMFFFL